MNRWLERILAGLLRRRWHTYDDYLRSKVWQSKRRRAIRRAGQACQVCNASRPLQVHHREYPDRWGNEPDEDLIVLCATCHQLFHRQFRPAPLNRSLRRARVRRSL